MIALWQSLSIHDATMIALCIGLLAAIIAANLRTERRSTGRFE